MKTIIIMLSVVLGFVFGAVCCLVYGYCRQQRQIENLKRELSHLTLRADSLMDCIREFNKKLS